jgi:hypothetical protein
LKTFELGGELIPLPPDTGWGAETHQLVRDRQYSGAHAVDCVLLRYLNEGDLRPLADLVRRGRAEPGPGALKLIAAMFDRDLRARFTNVDFRYEFRIKDIRQRGRPALGKAGQGRGSVREILQYGVAEMAEEKSPGKAFWGALFAALNVDIRQHALTRRGRSFPVEAKLLPIKKSNGKRQGRRPDPEIPMRDAALATLVQQRRDAGECYDAAVAGTLETINATAKNESRSVKICQRTIRNAPGRHKRRIKPSVR